MTGVVADEQKTIDLYFRWGLIKQEPQTQPRSSTVRFSVANWQGAPDCNEGVDGRK